jgi:hypothetical protein
MKPDALWVMVICVLGGQVHAQGPACGKDDACRSAFPPAVGAVETASAKPYLAQEKRCPGIPVVVIVTSPSEEESNIACSAAKDAVQLLGACDIVPRDALQLQIANELRHPFSKEPVFGLFDIRQQRVVVVTKAGIASLIEDTPYSELPVLDFYRSLIVHEIVHGIMHQNLKRPAASQAAYEYPAYALQLVSLPANARTMLLRAVPNRAGPGKSLFNDAILSFDPYFFAVHAYEHFTSTFDKCHLLHLLLEGELPFAPPLPP